MDESEDNLSAEEIKFENSSSVKVKPKKRSLVERELETSLTARVTSPILNKDATSTSRYGRARRLKTETDFCDTDKAVAKCLKSPKCDIAKSPNKIQSPAYKMHASNSPIRVETPKKEYLNNQIETIYSENISLSRFRPEEKKKSAAKKFPKVYIRKDLIQTKEREIDDTVVLIKNIFSPTKSVKKSKPGISLESSSEKNYSSKPNGYMNSLSVVKALDFDGNKKKKRDDRKSLSKSELFDLEAKCEYQVGDLAWARMGTYPFWPCIITRDPLSGMFVKKKLFGRIERDVMHVTFFGDNGRRGWIVDSMLRKFLGQLEFEATRINFSAEAKKKDPRLYTAFFISEKKTPQWQISVEEAEALLREPKRLRIDILNDMIEKSRALKTTPKQEKGRKVMRTNSDVSLSESLYDTLFSEDDSKVKETEGARSKSRNTSLDVSEVVTACLDNMAAKTGITRIQRQSHMDRWLQKAKSKTPEKSHHKSQIKESNSSKYKKRGKDKGNNKCKSYNRHNDHDYSQMYSLRNSPIIIDEMEIEYNNAENYDIEPGSGIGIISKVETLCGKEQYNDSTNADFINEIATENVAQSTDIESDIEQSNSVGSMFCGNDQNNGVSLKIVCQQNTDIESDIEQLDSVESSFCVNDQNNEVSPKIVCQKRIDIESDIERLDSVDSALCGNDQNNEVSPQIVCQQSTDIESDIEQLDSVESALCGNDQNNKVLQKIVCQQSTDIESDIEQLDSVESALCGSDQDNKVLQKIVCQQSTDIESGIEPLSSVESALCPNQKNEVSTQVMCQQSIGIESDIEQLDSVESSYCVNDQNNEVSPKIVCQQRTDIESDIEQLISIEPALCGNDQNNEVLPPIVCQQNTDIVSDVEQLDSVESDFSAGDQNNEGPRKIVCQQSTDIESDIEQLNSVESALCGNDQNNEVSPKIVCQQSTDIESDIEQLNSVESAEISSIQSELTDDHDKNESELIYEQNNEVELSTVTINEINKTHLIFSKIPDITDNNILDNIFATDDSSSDVDTNNESIENDAGKCENDEKATNFDNVVEIFSTEEHIDKNSQEGLFKVINQNESIDDQESGLDVNTSSVERVELDLESDIINSAIKTIVPLKEDQTLNEFNNSEVKINEDADFHKNNAINSETDVHEVDNNIEEIISPIIANSKSRKPRLKLSLKRSVVKDQTVDKNINVTEVNLNMNNVSNNQLQNGDIGINVDECVNLKELPQHVKIIDENREKTVINKDIESESLTSDINEIQRVDENMMRTNYEEHSNFNRVNTPKEIETQNQGTTKTDDLTSDIKIQHIGLDIKENENEDVTYMNEEKQKDDDNVSVISDGSEISVKRKRVKEKPEKKSLLTDPEFLKYLELRQDAVIDEHPELSQDDITSYLYKTWIYEENLKPDIKKTDDIDQANLVKGLNLEPGPLKKVRKRIKVDKEIKCENTIVKEKSKRKIIQPYYKEDFSDGDDSVEYFDIFKLKKDQKGVVPECKEIYQSDGTVLERIVNVDEYVQDEYDDVEEYFRQLTAPKPNVFKGYIREKVCDVCEKVGNLVKCKGCHSMFHIECDKKEIQITECQTPTRGRRKKKKTRGRKARDDPSQDSGSDEKSQDTNGSEELHMSVEEESHLTANADDFETLMAARMQEILRDQAIKYDFYYREELDWNDTHVGECKVVDIKPRLDSIEITDYSEFKCKNCQKYDPPVCFVCKYPISPKENQGHRQKCQVAHCNKYYHLECLDHWPQTQFNAGEVSRTNKFSEALTCPRHVCHTCVCDDPRGCKTRFSGDKLARCIRCPATYHTFTKCLPAGSQILTASHIICPRHYEHRPGKVPCHVNTGWCFICALGGSLICCEYCPTSFHAECLNIKPPEGGYMCEDCETGRLPLYGEMVWVKLGHYRWWPGIILHPSEIPDNILAVKHTLGEFVVRFFGQYDYYWVNRGRVFPFQEGDSGKVSSQRSKIDAAFTMAMEHAQRACGILKMAAPNEEESSDIASSLLPPHYVKLKVNKPCGSLCGKKIDLEESSLTQCECDPNYVDPCGPYTQCLNRMLLTECGPTCRAGDRCNNRAFEKRLYPRLAPYRTPHRGWGLRTLQDIRAGQFVIEYVGELIDEEEFRRRMNRKHEVRDENFYFLTLDKERMIDAGPKGNLARFMNHSCEPNCETQKWTVLGDVRVGLFAICDIPANSELTFNYNLETSGIEKKRCMCGAKRCSGYIGAKPKQEDQPKKIKPQVKRSYRKRKVEDSPSTSQYKKRGRPMKPRELTEIEKDLLIIKNATNGLSSDSECSRISIDSCKDSKALKRKRINLSSEEMSPKRSKDEMNLVY